jgi:ribonuclease VapC
VKKRTVILDSYALMAFFEEEPGSRAVLELLTLASAGTVELVMSVINWGEVYYISLREYGEKAAENVAAAIRSMPVKMVTVDEPMAKTAAVFKARYAISYADAFACALASHLNGEVVTGDREFREVEREITVWWI